MSSNSAAEESEESADETGLDPKHIELVASQAGVSRAKVPTPDLAQPEWTHCHPPFSADRSALMFSFLSSSQAVAALKAANNDVVNAIMVC